MSAGALASYAVCVQKCSLCFSSLLLWQTIFLYIPLTIAAVSLSLVVAINTLAVSQFVFSSPLMLSSGGVLSDNALPFKRLLSAFDMCSREPVEAVTILVCT